MKKSILIALGVFCFMNAHAQTTVQAKDADKHIGEKVTICEKVYSARYFDGSGITLINLGAAYPNQLLTILIKKDDRKNFKTKPEQDYKDKNICVTGVVIEFKGKPEIDVTDPEEIKIE